MRCEEALELIQRGLDGDLASEEEALLRRHLSTCIKCAAEADRLKRLSDDLSRLPRVTPPHSVVDDLIESGQLPERGRKRRFGWWLGGGVAAAVLLIGFTGLWAGRFGSDAPVSVGKPSLMMSSDTSDTKEGADSPSENMTLSAPEMASPVSPVLSPDGRFRAEVEGSQVVIRTEDGKRWFRSKPWKEGEVISMQWLSPTSLQVEIRPSTEGDAVTEVWIIDAEAKREKKKDSGRGDGG